MGEPLVGKLVERQGSVRTIATVNGPIRVKFGLLNFPIYAGEWSKASSGNIGWLASATVASNITNKQKVCEHSWLTWEEPQRVPTKFHPPTPCALLFCGSCGLALVFKL